MVYALFGPEMKPNIIGYPNRANAIRPYKNGILTISTSLSQEFWANSASLGLVPTIGVLPDHLYNLRIQIIAIFPCNLFLVYNRHRLLAAAATLFDAALHLNVQIRKLFFKSPNHFSLALVMFAKTNFRRHRLHSQNRTGRGNKNPLSHLSVNHQNTVTAIANQLELCYKIAVIIFFFNLLCHKPLQEYLGRMILFLNSLLNKIVSAFLCMFQKNKE